MNFNATLIGQSISFAVFVWFCMKFIWPLITAALEEREKKIADGLAAAEKGEHELELAENRAKEKLKESKDKAQEYIVQAQKRANEIVEEAKSSASAEGEKLLQAARSQIEQERNEARENLRQEVGVLAVAGAEQILMREVNAEAHKEVLSKLSAQL